MTLAVTTRDINSSWSQHLIDLDRFLPEAYILFILSRAVPPHLAQSSFNFFAHDAGSNRASSHPTQRLFFAVQVSSSPKYAHLY